MTHYSTKSILGDSTKSILGDSLFNRKYSAVLQLLPQYLSLRLDVPVYSLVESEVVKSRLTYK